jgi:mono/diheme cytochrome c family protein
MKRSALVLAALALLMACAADTNFNPLEDYEPVAFSGVLDAPTPDGVPAENRAAVTRGEYLVELLGCGACHTDGALIGRPDAGRALAGSRIGIAYTSPLENPNPGILFPPNITPDMETGIGRWSDQQIMEAIRAGLGRHAGRRIMVMPWQGYSRLSNDDARAILTYLRSLKPVRHRVPDDVVPGTATRDPYVHFGVYRSRDI